MVEQHPFFKFALWALIAACTAIWSVVGQTAVARAGETPQISRFTVHQVKDRLGLPRTVVIDVRTHRNWWRSSKKIPTAVREDPSTVDQWFERYSRNQTLIFYCS
jgi:hypothetical protein